MCMLYLHGVMGTCTHQATGSWQQWRVLSNLAVCGVLTLFTCLQTSPSLTGSQQCLFVTTRDLTLGIGQHSAILNTLISELGFSAVLFSLAFERFGENLNVRYDMMDRWKEPFFLCMKYFLQQF